TTIRQRQLEGSSRLTEVIGLVFTRWRQDPSVIAFYRDALITRGPEALSDLSLFAVSPWDDSFLEPLVRLIEASVAPPANAPANYRDSSTVDRGVGFLARNYSAWSRNTSIPPRLSKAVIEIHSAME